MAHISTGSAFQNCTVPELMVCNTSLLNSTANSSQARYYENLEDVLFDILGPRRSSFFIPVSLTYTLIFMVGVAGNLLTCTVIAKHQKMRTPTNLYLFSLAVSDLLVLVFGMPLEIYDMWQNYPFPFGEGGCYFKIFLFETVCFASVLNVMALSVERYIAVVHPLKTRYAVTNKHAWRVITSMWVISLVCAIPNTSLHGIFYLYLPEKVYESATCNLLKPLWMYNLVIQITTVLFYFVPMTVITVLYLVIGRQLGRESRLQPDKFDQNSSSDTSWKIHLESNRRRQVTKMLTVVVVVFGICWAPFHVDRLLWSSITQWTDTMHTIYQYVHILSGILFYLSSAVNPIIYNLLSSRFRERFRELVCRQSEAGNSPPFSKPQKSFSTLTSQCRSTRSLGPTIISGCWEHDDETACTAP
ncbi:neuromedin-U receptor 2-like [Arapaima gigas]